MQQSAWRWVVHDHMMSPEQHWTAIKQLCVRWESDGRPSMKSYLNLMPNWLD